jgi:hypothetical protein
MVPQFKAKAAYEMLHRFLHKDKLQGYNPKAKVSSLPQTESEDVLVVAA